MSNLPPLLQCPLGLAVTVCMRTLPPVQPPQHTAVPRTLVSFSIKRHVKLFFYHYTHLKLLIFSLYISGHADEARAHDSVKSQMLQYLTREEQQSVLHSSAACDVEDLEQFARYLFHQNLIYH